MRGEALLVTVPRDEEDKLTITVNGVLQPRYATRTGRRDCPRSTFRVELRGPANVEVKLGGSVLSAFALTQP
jgi:hypothetical protein